MRTTGKRKRPREVPSARSEHLRPRQRDQASPSSTSGGGGSRDPPEIQGAAARQADPVAAASEHESASPVALPTSSFFMCGQMVLPHNSPLDCNSPGGAPQSVQHPISPGNATPVASSKPVSPPRKCRTRLKKSTSPPRNKGGSSSPASSSSSSSSSFKTVTKRKKSYLDVVSLLKTYLQGVGSCLVNDMWEQNTFDLKINFCALRRVEKEAARKICNEYNNGMQAALSDAARDVVFESFKMKEFTSRFVDEEAMNISILHNFKLMICNMPKSILSLKTHIANLRGIALRSLFKNHAFSRKVVEMKECLRVVLVECLDLLVDGHRNNLSWNGQWGIDDWDFTDDHFFAFEVPVMKFEDPEKHMAACKADLKKFATEVLEGFKINGAYPPYLSHLYNELRTEVAGMSRISRQDYFGSEVAEMSRVHYPRCGWYMQFLQNHPALLTDAARIGLIQGWYHCINDIDYDRLEEFCRICESWEWTKSIREKRKDEVDPIAWLTFWHKAKKPKADADFSTWTSLYSDTWAQCHRFLRQLVAHAYRLTKFPGGNQSAEGTVEPELCAANLMPSFLPEFIKLLLRQGLMKKDFLLYWKGYCAQR